MGGFPSGRYGKTSSSGVFVLKMPLLIKRFVMTGSRENSFQSYKGMIQVTSLMLAKRACIGICFLTKCILVRYAQKERRAKRGDGASLFQHEWVPLLTFGKFMKPRCFQGVSCLPTEYEANSSAWMTSVVFEEW